MKKLLVTTLVLLIAALTFSSAANAMNADPERTEAKNGVDSTSEDIKKELGVSDGDVIYKLYNCPVILAFGELNSIEEILASDFIYQNSFAVHAKNSAPDVWRHYHQYGDKITETFDSLMDSISKDLQILLDGRDIINKIGKEIIVKNRYFFYNPTMCQGTAIYYETDDGDFVYYRSFRADKYLFSKDEFFGLMKEVRATMGPDTPPGGIDITSIRELSANDINSPNFSLSSNETAHNYWLIPCIATASVALVAVCVVIVVKKGKKKSEGTQAI